MNKIQNILKVLIILILSANFSTSFNKNRDFREKRILTEIRKFEKNNKKISLIGSIEPTEDIDFCHIYLCYNGKLIKAKNNNHSLFTIKDFDSKYIGLLFVSPENIAVNSEENTVSYLKLLPGKDHKFFTLTKKLEYCEDVNNNVDQLLTWKIRESKLNNEENEIEIPLNTLIIFLDPNSIEFSLENMKSKKDNNIIELPRIIIKSIKDKTKFEESCLAFMNLKCLHREQDRKEIIKENIKLSMLL